METKIIGGETYTKVQGGWQKQSSIATPEKRSFAGEILPTVGMLGGGIIGGIAGAAVGGVGAIPGAIGGAAIGGVGGEAIQQKIEKSFNQREKYDPAQIAASGVTGAATELTGIGLVKGVGMVAKASREPMIKFVSKLSGYEDAVVAKALERSSGAVAGVQRGESALKDIVSKANNKIHDLAETSIKEAKIKIAKFDQLSGGGAGNPGIRQSILQEGSNFVGNITNKLRSDFNIGVKKGNILDFDRPNFPSNIVSGTDRGALQSAFDTVGKIKNNTSIKQIDAVLERLITLKTKTPGGTPTGGETKKIISEMIDQVQGFVVSAEKFGKGYKEYVAFLKENLPKRVMIEEAKDIFGTSRYLSPIEQSQVEKRLFRLYNTGELPVREAVEKIGTEVGEEIVETTAGAIIKTGKQPSVEATMPTPRNMVTKLIEVLPRAAVNTYIKTGKITGELSNSPYIKTAAKLLGLTEREVINLLENKTSN